MRLAVLADIHGNLDALNAVLVDLERYAPDALFVLGDHASGPLDAAGTLDRLMGLGGDVRCLRGNHDRWLVEREPAAMGPSDAHARARLSERHLDWLAALPPIIAADGAFACHGTPRSDSTYWLDEVAEDGRVRARGMAAVEGFAAEALTEGASPASLLLCGHTHVPRIAALGDGRLVVNPGSVGLPAYDDDAPVPHVMESGLPHAAYALAERAEAGAWSVTQRYVPYDTEPMARLAEANGRPAWAQAIRTGRLN